MRFGDLPCRGLLRLPPVRGPARGRRGRSSRRVRDPLDSRLAAPGGCARAGACARRPAAPPERRFRVGARPLAAWSCPRTASFRGPGGARRLVFDDRFLLADGALLARLRDRRRNALPNRHRDAISISSAVPVLNRLLLPLWVRDEVEGVEVLRYPGAVLRRQDATGEPVRTDRPIRCASRNCFPVARLDVARGRGGALPVDGSGRSVSRSQSGGWASLVVRYPFQAAGMQAWRAASGAGQDMVDALDPTTGRRRPV